MIGKTEFNKDFWVVYSSPFFGRSPIGYDRLISFLGSKAGKVLAKLESNISDKFVVRPHHGEVYIFYRH